MHNGTRVDVTLNATDPSVFIPGEFEPHSVCFGDITQQESYYIFMVSAYNRQSVCAVCWFCISMHVLASYSQ